MRPFLLGPKFFRTAPRALVVIWSVVGCRYRRSGKLERGRNFWKSRRRCQVCRLSGVCWSLDDCVCVIWLNMTTPPSWMEKVVVYYFWCGICPVTLIQSDTRRSCQPAIQKLSPKISSLLKVSVEVFFFLWMIRKIMKYNWLGDKQSQVNQQRFASINNNKECIEVVSVIIKAVYRTFALEISMISNHVKGYTLNIFICLLHCSVENQYYASTHNRKKR